MTDVKALPRLPAHNHVPYHPVCREQNIGDCILRDYEAAVDALDRLLKAMWAQQSGRTAEALSDAHAVLRRIRG